MCDEETAPCFTYGPTMYAVLRLALTWSAPSCASSSITKDERAASVGAVGDLVDQ